MTFNSPVLVTGAAGFIGHAVSERLLGRGERVIGIDSLNNYYDPGLKTGRLATLADQSAFEFRQMNIADAEAIAALVSDHGIQRIVHLAAQAGVRYSLEDPFAYQQANLAGHLSILEAVRKAPDFVHLVYASSSSVYGDRPIGSRGFREDEPAVAPASLYAATKRAGELMSEAYSRLYGIAQSGLRFFTVYGPWGRPDMAYFGFTRKILSGEAIDIYGDGRMARDLTYIDDVVEGVVGVLDRPPERGTNRLLNVGSSSPVGLIDLITTLERVIGVTALKTMLPMQPGDVTSTYADNSRLHDLTGYVPGMNLEEGLQRFYAWYTRYYSSHQR